MISPLIVIVGPTASGKSAFAFEVALRLNGEIICADSRTVYKGLDIGTAKPTREERGRVRHHGLDIVEPNQPFSAADFQRLARDAIDEISTRGKLPIMVGGTGLYIDSVIYNYQFGQLPPIDERAKLNDQTIDQLIEYCKDNSIEIPQNPLNKRYVIRAIEQGGINRQRDRQIRPQTIVVGISADKTILEERIKQRATQMFSAGVVKEATSLAHRYGWEASGLDGNIYPILRSLVAGEISREEAVELFVRSDLQLAKRQMTWFKRSPDIHWSNNPDELLTRIEHFLTTVLPKT